MTRSVIDPITRIEGHLRVEMEVTNGKVSDAGCPAAASAAWRWSSRTARPRMLPRSCSASAACARCPHAHSSAIAAEKAYGIKISNNARIIRNLIEGAQFLHSHILWFYNLAASTT